MLHRCPECGAHEVAPTVAERPDGPVAVCPECGHERSLLRPPLCIVTGASGTGKTTVRRALAGEVEAVLLEDDAIAHEACEFDADPEFNEYVLRICRLVAQSGVPPVLFTTGMGVPEYVESLDNRRYFAESHYLALVCDDDVQASRLRARGSPWTDDGEGSYWADVDRQVEFNLWFREHADEEGIDTLDTGDADPGETAAAVADWLSERLGSWSKGSGRSTEG